MKTAEEMRKLAKASSSGSVKKVLDFLEKGIENKARNNLFTYEVCLDKKNYGLDAEVVNRVVEELDNAGYKVVAKTIYDQRDGNSVHFKISWKG